MCYEEDIPAEQPAKKEKTWFPASDANPQRSQDPGLATEKRTQDPLGLMGRGLPRTRRLRKRADFQKIYRNGIQVVGRFVVLFAVSGPEAKNRLGITASRKIGSAVTRNRCKRRIRELYRQNRSLLPNCDIDIVVNVRRGCAEVPWHEIMRDYARSLARLNKEIEQRTPGNTARTKR
jgi:ribonuclease P protein component